jgi:transposase
MRKGFEGLYGLVRDRLSCEPLSGHLFLFYNAQRNRLKVLVWGGSGLWVCAKRLEKGRFTWPQSGDAQGKVVLSHAELSPLLSGIAQLKSKLQYAELRIRVLEERLRLMRIEKYGTAEKIFRRRKCISQNKFRHCSSRFEIICCFLPGRVRNLGGPLRPVHFEGIDF